MSVSGINNEEIKRRAQYINMRGAQLASEMSNQPTVLGSDKARGSKKQLIGTIAGIAAAAGLLFLLACFRVI